MADSGFWSLFWLWGCLICKALFAQLHSVKFNWILCFVSTLVWAKMNGHIRREWVLTVSMGIRRHSFSSYCVYIFERERQTGIHTHTHTHTHTENKFPSSALCWNVTITTASQDAQSRKLESGAGQGLSLSYHKMGWRCPIWRPRCCANCSSHVSMY